MVEVTNTWANRLIGDETFPDDVQYARYPKAYPPWMDGSVPRSSPRQTFTLQKFFDQNDSLSPSGLLGPVVIKSSRTIKLETHP